LEPRVLARESEDRDLHGDAPPVDPDLPDADGAAEQRADGVAGRRVEHGTPGGGAAGRADQRVELRIASRPGAVPLGRARDRERRLEALDRELDAALEVLGAR